MCFLGKQTTRKLNLYPQTNQSLTLLLDTIDIASYYPLGFLYDAFLHFCLCRSILDTNYQIVLTNVEIQNYNTTYVLVFF